MTASDPNPLLAGLGQLLQWVLNRALALDPQAAQRLQALDGRSLEFHWAPADIGLTLRVSGASLAIGPPGAPAPDLALSGNLAGFARLAFPGAAARLPPGKVTVAGDAELARELERLLKSFSPDLLAPIDERLGPVAGALASRVLGGVLPRLRDALASVPGDVADYLREERRDTVAREEIEDFASEVDRLRDDVERLAARLSRLAAEPPRP